MSLSRWGTLRCCSNSCTRVRPVERSPSSSKWGLNVYICIYSLPQLCSTTYTVCLCPLFAPTPSEHYVYWPWPIFDHDQFLTMTNFDHDQYLLFMLSKANHQSIRKHSQNSLVRTHGPGCNTQIEVFEAASCEDWCHGCLRLPHVKTDVMVVWGCLMWRLMSWL